MMNLVAISEELSGLSDDQIEKALDRLVARERNSQAVRRMQEQSETRVKLLLDQLRHDRSNK